MTDPIEGTPTYVIVGHIARDMAPGGYVPGGTALYSALTARRLGVVTGVLTSGDEAVRAADLEGAMLRTLPSPESTVFENRYEPEGRVQSLHGRARSLTAAEMPQAWLAAPILHLGPIADEVEPAIANLFPHALRAATPQGWLRRLDDARRVHLVGHEAIVDRLPPLDLIVVSEEDVAGDEKAVDAYRERARIVILTSGARGATLYAGEGTMHIPAVPAREVDPTGAGDVFTTAFLIQYYQNKDLLAAGRFAAAAAALVVEKEGPVGIPTLAEVEERLSTIAPA